MSDEKDNVTVFCRMCKKIIRMYFGLLDGICSVFEICKECKQKYINIDTSI